MTHYIITLDLDSTRIPEDGLDRLATIASSNGFSWNNKWLTGSQTATSVDAVLLVQTLAADLDWFKAAVCDLRLLRINDDIDLMRAIRDYPADDGPLTDEDLARIEAVAAPKLPRGQLLKRESLLPNEVFESSNEYVEKNGLPLEKYRMF